VPFNQEQVILPHFVDKVIAVRGANQWTLMPAEVVYHFQINPGIFEETGSPVTFSMLTPVGVGSLPPNPPEQLLIASSAPEDSGKRVFIRGESGGTEVIEEVVLGVPQDPDSPPAPITTPPTDPATTPQPTRYAYDVPLTISKDLTVGDVTVNSTSSDQLLELIPAGARERKHLRLWLLPPPASADMTCIVLGKRKITPLRTDEDTPIMSGAAAVLIAGAAADLFTKLGNNAGAGVYQAKAAASAKVLASENMDQNAYAPKLVPMIEPHALGEGCWSKV
jgi:hypothetical protein